MTHNGEDLMILVVGDSCDGDVNNSIVEVVTRLTKTRQALVIKYKAVDSNGNWTNEATRTVTMWIPSRRNYVAGQSDDVH